MIRHGQFWQELVLYALRSGTGLDLLNGLLKDSQR